jgi:hypothetical protein
MIVVMVLETCSAQTEDIEQKLDEADRAAVLSDVRYTHDEVFSRLKHIKASVTVPPPSCDPC